jgi:hypothetical protein
MRATREWKTTVAAAPPTPIINRNPINASTMRPVDHPEDAGDASQMNSGCLLDHSASTRS